jgi:hypothetical protein
MQLGRDRFPRFDHKRKRKSFPIFSIEETRRQNHFWIIGKTGQGKSSFLQNAIQQDIRAGNGLALFDPHGDLAEAVLALIPPKRRKDVILLDPTDHDYPIGFNILDRVPIERRPFVASSVVDCFKAIWGSSWGPQLEMFLYAGAAALLDFPDGTLVGLKFLITSKSYRTRVLGHIRDPAVRDFWQTDFQKHMPEKEQRERTLSMLNKIGQLITDPSIRNIIGQPTSRLSFTEIMNSKKIFIASLRQGDLGIQKSSLIGSLLISSIHLAALQRTANRTPFHVYVDEFHNFHGFNEMVSGIRKFGISLTLSHQYISQLTPDLRDAMLGTIGTIISFQIGGDDADRLSKTFHIKPEELTALEPYTAYVTTGAKTTLIKMEPPPEALYPASPRAIRRRCKALAVPREHVESRMNTFIKNTS